MPDTSALELFAEISIGLVGFAGVVSALGRSRLPPPTRSFRTTALLLYSVVALAGSLIPIVLLNHGVNATSVWLASGVVLVTAQIAVMLWASVVTRPLLRQNQLHSAVPRMVMTLFLGAVCYLLYGIFFKHDSLPAIYLVGLSFTLSLGIFHFVVLVVSIQADARDEGDTGIINSTEGEKNEKVSD